MLQKRLKSDKRIECDSRVGDYSDRMVRKNEWNSKEWVSQSCMHLFMIGIKLFHAGEQVKGLRQKYTQHAWERAISVWQEDL